MKIAYWSTSSLEPRYEAVSQEVFRLARAFPGSWVFAVSPHYPARFSWKGRYAGIHAGVSALARGFIPLLERAFDLSHVYGDMTPWLFHKSLGARPIIHTVTRGIAEPVLGFLARCAAVVVQTESTRERVLGLGIDPARVHLRLPGVDLARFRPPRRAAPPGPRPRILFSTAPRSAEEMEGRGVLLLLDAARRSPEASFRLLYRTWRRGYTSLAATRRAVAERGLGNVELTDGVVPDMPAAYAESDFTVVPYTARDGGKECPNSALESLACGVPVLVSRACPFARFVEENRCGVTFEPTPDALLAAVEAGLRSWPELSQAARRAAEAHADAGKLIDFYEALYLEAACAPATKPTRFQKSPA